MLKKLLYIILLITLFIQSGFAGAQDTAQCNLPKSYEAKTSDATLESATILPEGKEVHVNVTTSSKLLDKACAWLLDEPLVTTEAKPVPVINQIRDPKAPDNKTQLTLALPDDITSFWYKTKWLLVSSSGGDITIKAVKKVTISNSSFAFVIALLLTLAAYTIAVLSLGRIQGRGNRYCWSDPVYLTSNSMDRASMSQFQVFCFTLLVFYLLVDYLLCFGLLSNISENILGLLGISAGGAVASKVVDVNKNRLSLENWSWLRNQGWLKVYEEGYSPPAERGKQSTEWGDLLTTGASFDIYKFQVAIFSLLVGIGLVTGDLSQLSSFVIPQNLLYLLGLSNLIYVGGKLTTPDNYGELDQAINRVREAEKAWLKKDSGALLKSYEEVSKNPSDEYNAYLLAAREAARILQTLFCENEGDTKFGRKENIDAKDLWPMIPSREAATPEAAQPGAAKAEEGKPEEGKAGTTPNTGALT